MFGLFLVLSATFFNEIGTSIGKKEVADHKESIYTMGFLNLLWGALFLLAIVFLVPKDFFAPGFPGGFTFALASLPTFLPRIILEVVQAHVAMRAIARADRSTFGFLRILTIPLLLLVDFTLGYTIGLPQILGVLLIVLSLILLFINHGLSKKGSWLIVFTAINAVATISLFKYNITNFNSVEAEQGISLLVLLIYFFLMAFYRSNENPATFLKKPIFLLQSLSRGVGWLIMSFAYLYAPASIITTGKRSFAILAAMLSGNVYFHEKKLALKIFSFALIVAGLVFLVL